MHDPGDAQPVAMSWQDEGHDRYAVSGLGQRQQGMRGAALDKNIRPDPGKPARGIERVADHETGFQQQERIRRKAADIDISRRPEPLGCMTGG